VRPDLGCRTVPGLALAGQVLGTSGYEEAAAQGLIAGVNAVLAGRGEPPFVPGRETAYIGVLVDDLVSKEHTEPYRMFTSRAEHRLLLGVDSARERLMADGVRLGLVRHQVFHVEHSRWSARARARRELEEARLNPDGATRTAVRSVAGVELTGPTTWARVLRRHDVDRDRLADRLEPLAALDAEDRRIVIGLLCYEGYVDRHRREIERIARLRDVTIPADLEPAEIPGLSREVVEQLERYRPPTLADAERVPGITPAALAILAGRIRRGVGG
jgi:tRNA uridine 5-carboxymethylaminomethyl modification enzyme